MGRVKSPFPRGDRHAVVLPDGATVTFDIFEPVKIYRSKGRYSEGVSVSNPRKGNVGGTCLLIGESLCHAVLIITSSGLPYHF